ncbi:hypothetical protein Metme_1284 [Methylomonas methanica MC09]|uniref:Uncharacterized protein n=1 Tax=Methylomonas methanica (strain DSM 25384 / MC09) TaxID=857087 RepID=F9ZXA0_METMM|nr:hypothetical protein Metme_1284 [Methylomonas methanica MC09]
MQNIEPNVLMQQPIVELLRKVIHQHLNNLLKSIAFNKFN